ncbi:type II toxin-antitoxin system RelE/ParE family toxin [Anaerophaga thermohalophila]|uniref:type II toxin-antitoxin system RelE/ParE family toxin n=1 Tax=Anaerophaga thermohalophila TaxID=177400 RepID=UPI000237D3A3|nr:type II toxin-antitoxin system RelE/ParE family toxin [Anaerophaga thermohalophila]
MKVTKFSIEISDEAEIDFDKSYEYYFEESPKVANAFFKRINISLEDIKQNPFTFPIAHKEVRKYLVRKFPFVIYYQIDNSTIKVVAIFHTSRNPEIWNERT